MAAKDQDFVLLNAADLDGFDRKLLQPLSPKEIVQVQTWLQPTDYAATSSEFGKHASSHLAGTGAWMLQTDQYRQWHRSDRGALWIKAVAGAGKSVIAAASTRRLMSEGTTPVLYFFFRHIVSANQKPQSLIRDYMSQLLASSVPLQHDLYALVQKQRTLDSVSLEQMWETLVSALTSLPRVYCVVDALDEMDTDNDIFLERLLALGQLQPTSIKLLMTSRPVPRVERVLRHPSVLQLLLQAESVNPDISRYARHRASELDVSATLSTTIHSVMSTRADGHFLYARLMMDDLSELCRSSLGDETQMMAALDALPSPMADMYTKMLHDHARRSKVSQELQVTLLQWVTRAEHPVRLLELSRVIDADGAVFAPGMNPKAIVREGCGPLLEILEDETVCPIHHSFTEYLYDQARQKSASLAGSFPVLKDEDAQVAIALTCIKQLTSGWHHPSPDEVVDGDPWFTETRRTKLKLKYPLLDYAVHHWHAHVRKSNASNPKMIAELDKLLLNDPGLLLALLQADPPPRSPFVRGSENVAPSWTALHTAADKGLAFYVEHLIREGLDIERVDVRRHAPLALAALRGHTEVVEILLKAGANGDQNGERGRKPLHHASIHNHHRIVKVLLQSGIDRLTEKTREDSGRRCWNARSTDGGTPLQYACEGGHTESIREFLPYLERDDLQLALQWAVQSGRAEAAALLLQVPGIDINAGHESLLLLACRAGDIDTIRALLSMGAKLGSAIPERPNGSIPVRFRRGWHRSRRLLHAVVSGQTTRWTLDDRWDKVSACLTALLDAGVDPNTTDTDGSTVLHLVMELRDARYSDEAFPHMEHLLSMLFARGLSAKILMGDGSNAFHSAACLSQNIADMLSDQGADVDHIRESDGLTPLMSAFKQGYSSVAKILLACGADTSLADRDGNTALHLATQRDGSDLDFDVLETLLTAGANPNARNKDGNTPLHLNRLSNPELTRLFNRFVEHGLDLETKNKAGQTLLSRYSASGVEHDRFRMLIDAGANLLTRDARGRTLLHGVVSQPANVNTNNSLRYLIEKGVDPCATDSAGNTLWHTLADHPGYGSEHGARAIADILTEHGVSPTKRNNLGQLPFHVACSQRSTSQSPGPIEFLINAGLAPINTFDDNKIRPLHLAASYSLDLTHQMLESGSDITAMTLEGQTALMVACRNRQCNIVGLLLDHYKGNGIKDFVDQKDVSGRSALHYACRSGVPETVWLLVEAGASVNLKDNTGLTPLDACAEFCEEEAMWIAARRTSERDKKASNILLREIVRPVSSNDPETPTRIRETIRMLVHHGADVSFLMRSPFDMSSRPNPLVEAVDRGCDAMASELLAMQESMFQAKLATQELERRSQDNMRYPGTSMTRDEEGRLTEDVACIDSEAKPTTTSRNRTDEELDIKDVQALWKQFLSSDKTGVWLLHTPHYITQETKAGFDTRHMVERLLKKDDEQAVLLVKMLRTDFLKPHEPDESRKDPIVPIVSWGFADLLRTIGQDATQMITTGNGEMASLNANWPQYRLYNLLIASLRRSIPNLNVFKILMTEYGLSPDQLFPEDSGYRGQEVSVLHILAQPKEWWQLKALEYLLIDQNANVDTLDSHGETPLLTALRARHGPDHLRLKVVTILLAHGANANAIGKDGATCLNVASGRTQCIQMLLAHGADPSAGIRPLIFDAIKEQNVEILKLIVESGVDVNVRYGKAATPSTKALSVDTDDDDDYSFESPHYTRGFWHRVVCVTDLSNRAYPIHVAASQFFDDPSRWPKAVEIVNLLIDAGADPTLRYDEDDLSILHVLVEQGGILEPLFKHAKFDLEARDRRGRTLLLSAGKPNKNRYPPRPDQEYVSLLINHGASVNAVDQSARNILHHLASGYAQYPKEALIPDDILSNLVRQRDNKGRTPFHYALDRGRFDLVDIFLDHGADICTPDPRDGSIALHHMGVQLGDGHDFKLQHPQLDSSPPQQKASSTLRERLLGFEEDDMFSSSNEHCVVVKDEVEVSFDKSPLGRFNAMLKRGLSINARDHKGETPLHWLLKKRGLPRQFSNHLSTLQVLELLEQQSITPNIDFTARDSGGESALHKLATRSDVRESYQPDEETEREKDLKTTFNFLVAKGVDAMWEDDGSRTCLDIAAANGSRWLLNMFQRKKTKKKEHDPLVE